MSTIWRYPLVFHNEIDMPEGATLLTVQVQHGQPTLWAHIYPGEPLERRVIELYETSRILPPDPGVYVATFQMPDLLGKPQAFHVFDATKVA